MKYFLTLPQPARGYFEIRLEISSIDSDSIQLQLPSWRPGRYELSNFAKNIRRFDVYDKNGNKLKFRKVTKDLWEIEVKSLKSIVVEYDYYTETIDAGNCYAADDQLYINPIHCCLYDPERMNEKCELELKIPIKWKVATGLKKISTHKFIAADYHTLVDSPLICSGSLQHNSYQSSGIDFHIWFQGECKPDWQRILKDFKKFSDYQLKMMKGFPAKDFHFLIQVTPFSKYHGVEHVNSTVLALGPGCDLMTDLYGQLLGVASHELFHVWNIKTIRPQEMYPYDYTKENYSKLGYVAEGVTTYYGDILLFRSGVINTEKYFIDLSQRLNQHFINDGRKNLSVADSSFDTWLDGYVPGIPGRKTSIYTEGALCALMIDLIILSETSLQKSLADVMSALYHKYALKGKGYTEADYMNLCSELAGKDLSSFFASYVYGTRDFEAQLKKLLSSAGLELKKTASQKALERVYGIRLIPDSDLINYCAEGSGGDKAGLRRGDRIVSVNSYAVDRNAEKWAGYFSDEKKMDLSVEFMGKIRTITVSASGKNSFDNYNVIKNINATEDARKFFKAWANWEF